MPLIIAKDRFDTDGPAYLLTAAQDLEVSKGTLVGSRVDSAIVGTSANQSVIVSGTVVAYYSGINLGDDASGDTGCVVRVARTGSVTGSSGIGIGAKSFLIDNDGTLTGSNSGITYNAIGAGTSRIQNDGLIAGGSYGVARFGFDLVGQKIILTNTGKIIGGNLSYYSAFADSVDVIVNRGVMRGDISTGVGNDVVDNRAGRIVGGIYGGPGNDHFLPGLGVETWDGEGGAFRDLIDFRAMGAVHVALDNSLNGTGAAKGDTYAGIEDILGSLRGADLLHGNADGNRLAGNGGNDALQGLLGADTLTGGTGHDRLIGGGGDDHFAFKLPGEGGDVITDFGVLTGNDDLIQISRSGFGAGLAVGVLTADRYHEGATNQANDADCRFILRTGDDTLWFDRDGRGGAAPVLIVDLPNVDFDYNDILIV
jgi:Ca2+-binding RTX toxin-like protein